MHPNTAFAWSNDEDMLAFVEKRGFGQLCIAAEGMVRTASVPFVKLDQSRIGFHVARGNSIRKYLAGAQALLCVHGPDAYVSPDWYGVADQVPTWNYVAAELRGKVTEMTETELIDQIDRLSAMFEARLAPKKLWTRDKMMPGIFERMLKGIAGYSMTIDQIEGVRKLSQNKPVNAVTGVIAALDAAGEGKLADWMRGVLPE